MPDNRLTTENQKYDKTEEYTSYIKDRIKELAILCRYHKIPFYVTLALKNDENNTEYISNAAMPPSFGLNLTNDRLRKLVLVDNDFDVVPKKKAAIKFVPDFTDDTETLSDTEIMERLISDAEAVTFPEFTEEEKRVISGEESAYEERKAKKIGRPRGNTEENRKKQMAKLPDWAKNHSTTIWDTDDEDVDLDDFDDDDED